MTPADALAQRIAAAIGQPAIARAMAVAVVRFSGDQLAHVGDACTAAIQRALAGAPAQLTYRGFLPTATGRRSQRAPAPVRATFLRPLASFAHLPAGDESLPPGVAIYVKDGEPAAYVPDRFALWLHATAPHGGNGWDAEAGGDLRIAVPLDQLASPAGFLELVDELVARLAAEVAWAGPAVWTAPRPDPTFWAAPHVFRSADDRARLTALWMADPQVDVPAVHAFYKERPSPFAGFVAPAWAMWATGALATAVRRFGGERTRLAGHTRFVVDASPFTMTAADRATWSARWAELAPLHVTVEDTGPDAVLYRSRFELGAASGAAARAPRRRARTRS